MLSGPAHAEGLYAECRGQTSASPTVVLESGLFGTADDWDWVLDDLARGGRVCTYDRAGLGPSQAKPGAQDVDGVTSGLAALLDGMGETAPIILVGHSNGALYAEGFAARWPQRVAGLLYINGVNSIDLDHPLLVKDMEAENRLAQLVVKVFKTGVGPVIAFFVADASDLRPPAAANKRKILSRLGHIEVGMEEDLAMIPGMKTVRAEGGSPPHIPTAVIVSLDPKSEVSRAWRDAGAEIVAKARTGWLMTAPGASHTSPLARDRAYVDAAVRWLRSVHASQDPAP
jgi:pimeloyl-ACP methyl ester carboxylesterase